LMGTSPRFMRSTSANDQFAYSRVIPGGGTSSGRLGGADEVGSPPLTTARRRRPLLARSYSRLGRSHKRHVWATAHLGTRRVDESLQDLEKSWRSGRPGKAK
jgi:hypothetical protein